MNNIHHFGDSYASTGIRDKHFVNWLYSKDYHKEEECHYTFGVQELIYDEIIKQMVF
jgi:hypothetical protein